MTGGLAAVDAATIGAMAGLITATIAGLVTLIRVAKGAAPDPALAPETQESLGAKTNAAAIDALALRLVEQDRANEAARNEAAGLRATASEAVLAAREARVAADALRGTAAEAVSAAQEARTAAEESRRLFHECEAREVATAAERAAERADYLARLERRRDAPAPARRARKAAGA